MKEKNIKIPRLAKIFLLLFLPSSDYHNLAGDFEELYYHIYKEQGRVKAYCWISGQIIKSILPFFSDTIYWGIDMLTNYLKVAVRHLIRQKVYSLINIAGLSVGMACCVLIMLWVNEELSYDKFHKNADNIYRIVNREVYSSSEEFTFSSCPPLLGPTLQNTIPEIKYSSRFRSNGELVVGNDEKLFNETGVAFVDPNFLEVFDFPILSGDKISPLSDINSLIISENMAEKYFGEEDPIGKILKINNENNFVVSAVIKNVPGNSHLKFDMLLPFEAIKNFGKDINTWKSYYVKTYIMLDSKTDEKIFNTKIKDLIKKYDNTAYASLFIQPLVDIHLYSKTIGLSGKTGDIKYVYIFSIIAIFILLTACINFMNLSTARSGKRAKEIGLRKVVGAKRSEIIKQFYSESILLAFIAMSISIVIVILFIPVFNSIAAKTLEFNFINDTEIILVLISTALVTGIVSGSYPAIYLSRFMPSKVFKDNNRKGTKSGFSRKLLVSFQFCLTIALIVGTLIINDQLKFLRNQNLGYDKNQILCIDLKGDLTTKTDNIKNEFASIPSVLEVSAVSNSPSSINRSVIINDWQGNSPGQQFFSSILLADYNLIETLKLEMKEGRYFSKKFVADTTEGVVINEAAQKVVGLEDPIGKKFSGGKIIGVVKDFHYKSLHSKIDPLVIFYGNKYNKLLVKIKSKNILHSIDEIKNKWAGLYPEFPFEFQFLDEQIEKKYRSDMRIEKIINLFAYLIIFISCLGLFGLASFTAEQRKKEIGIRKVLGASVARIFLLLSKEFTSWIVISNIIAWPIAWYFMNNWLENFAFKINLTLFPFLFAALITLSVALCTISVQVIKASLQQPVKSLRTE